MLSLSRRQFHSTVAWGSAAAALASSPSASILGQTSAADGGEKIAFFVIGDTHFLAQRENPTELDETSLVTNKQLIATLNRLAGTEIPIEAGGGMVKQPRGLIHAGDIIDTGDKIGNTQVKMQHTEWEGFQKVFGLTGKEGELKMPVYEVHGNHDSPNGVGLAIDGIKDRNAKREGLKQRSANGMHYSWDWGGIHFVNAGITVGAGEKPNKRRRYAPLESLDFLIGDLEQHVGTSGRPVVITHHVDMLRYSGPCNMQDDAKPLATEWDSCDVHAYYQALQKYTIAGIFYGHTHVRNIYRWNDTPMKGEKGLPVFNVDNSAHFSSDAQALFYVELDAREIHVRELATKNRWLTSNWTEQSWRVKLG